ncbi:hypothetical protein BDV34DRAFT_207653 [Aspergillus parasiticus]|uniref:Uncharacterized protein n=1 Tax=Aspergillus parasiticus TaxID=5067 RepID=A0A5N6D184_ASPPA|nr:hypothetical protein BDV34DRAFT_207653 [Aspergillus parasiticus]
MSDLFFFSFLFFLFFPFNPGLLPCVLFRRYYCFYLMNRENGCGSKERTSMQK